MSKDGLIRGKKDNSKRRFHGGGPRPDLNELKRKEAMERQEAWSKLTPEQQLKALDSRPGESKRQRARLQLLIEKRKHQPKPEPKGAAPVGQLIEKGSENIKAKERRAAEQAKRPSK
jgi:hypothetical protein